MSIDGIFLYKLKEELSLHCENTRVEKVHQPSKEELVLLLRSAQGSKRLLLCARPSSPRVSFTENSHENPAEPPMFCMLMRKYLQGARFSYIEDNGFERIVTLVFQSVNEMGDKVKVKLIAEFIGNKTNIILVGDDGRILDALKRSDVESGGRMILPGAIYVLPDKQNKLDILNCDIDIIAEAVCSLSVPIAKALVSVVDGFSPLIAREIVVRADIDTDKASDALDKSELLRLKEALKNHRLMTESIVPTVLVDDKGIPFEFSYIDIIQYGSSVRKQGFASLSTLLEMVFAERDRKERIKGYYNELQKVVSVLKARITKKIDIRLKEQEKCQNGEKYRVFGELLKANLHTVDRGVPFVDVQNYYDPELSTVRIPLDVSLTPAQNAQRYFKEYKKCCNAQIMLKELLKESRNELLYIDSVADELTRATTLLELNEIKTELTSAGYIADRGTRKKVQKVSMPEKYTSPDGFTVLVGKNNRQNDELTLHIADDTDMWFHTKNIPGSHVIVRCDGEELPESTILFAAYLAAKHSKAADSSAVPVDYTRVKYVKKPAKAKPGMVIYKTNKTVYVTPNGD